MRQLVRGLLLALALLLAQQGALLHRLSHDAGAATQQEGDDSRHAHSGLCIACVAFAELGAGAASHVTQHVAPESLAFRIRTVPATLRRSLEAPTQRSRGPPTLL